MLGRKPKDFSELLKDADIVYHVGKLIGAAEMTAYVLTLNKDEEIQMMGKRLGEIVDWFFMPDAELGSVGETKP